MNNFRIFTLTILIILFCGNLFSQTDTTYKTDDIFSINYVNSLNKISDYRDIRLTYIDSNSLRFEREIYENGKMISRSYKVNFNKINSFGYKAHATAGEIIGTGALIGFGTGFIIGVIAGRIDIAPHSTKHGDISFGERLKTGLGLGLAMTVPALLISLCIPAKPYENLEISKYDTKKKFKTIKTLIKKGVKQNL